MTPFLPAPAKQLLLGLTCLLSTSLLSAKTLLLPHRGFEGRNLAIIVNDSDRLSKQIGTYYQTRHQIPEENMIHVRFRRGSTALKERTFDHIYQIVKAKTPPHVQAYLLTWAKPFRVGCMSISMAFATGYDKAYCPKKIEGKACGLTKKSPYYGSLSQTPAQDHGLRPTMLLAALNLEDAKALIDRGVQANGNHPKGKAYLLSTSDQARNVRAATFHQIEEILAPQIPIELLKQDAIQDKDDILFYFTGRTEVPHLETLTFVPGAVADHLTSSGGHMKDKGIPGQMSSLRWLEAGATGSYGTVFEPCNFTTKFPNPGILMSLYLRGESLIEAYWKSVAWPSEGLFIGDPLAKPFALKPIQFEGNQVSLPLPLLWPGKYRLGTAIDPVGPYEPTGMTISATSSVGNQPLTRLTKAHYRLERVE